MPTSIILDTNVLLHDPQAIFQFGDATVLVPMEVIEEIDRFKHDTTESGRNSRSAARSLDALRQGGSLGDGVPLETGGALRVVQGRGRKLSAGDSVLQTARDLRERGEDALVVTKNVNLRIKADALGIEACDYDENKGPDVDQYRGWHEMDVEPAVVEALRNGNGVRPASMELLPHEYLFLHDEEAPKHAVAAKVDAEGKMAWPLLGSTRQLCGIRGLNIQQTFAIDALLDDSIRLITLAGKAGTGKTLLAIAAGLHQVFSDDKFHRLTVFRPTIAVSRDLGYLPGGLDDKMRPWMQPVYDAIDLIRLEDRKQPARILPNDVRECDEVTVEPLTYIRGRSIPNQFIIIDEAQNLTPLEVKTAVTRVGAGSKIVVTGDPHQIDNPYVDFHSNGLISLVDRFRESRLSAHITMVKGERSELAETAANLL
ncbi:MAG: PhoH family protein [Victivallales bacterium]|jgi:PhoH-like ATPase|nr:PhoH family protein [Victivallales bacterium]MBT7166607.1 PhoH family protein [Victivallales bacterium]MBT7304040.1 PhoH family protein [Victivallales bacterium]